MRWATAPRNKEDERVARRMPPLRAVLMWIATLTLMLFLVLYISIRIQGAEHPPVIVARRAALKGATPVVVGAVERAVPRRAATLLPKAAAAAATTMAAAATAASAS